MPRTSYALKIPGFRDTAITGPSEMTEIGDHGFVAQNDSVLDRCIPSDVTLPAENRLADGGVLADPRVGPEDGSLDHGVFLNVAVPPNDAVGADAGAGLDHRSLADEAGRFERHPLLDAGVRGDPGRRGCVSKGRRAEAAIHDVAVNLRVFVGRS